MNPTDIVALTIGRAILGAFIWLGIFTIIWWLWWGVNIARKAIARKIRGNDPAAISYSAYREMIRKIHAVPVEEYSHYDHVNKVAVRKPAAEKRLAVKGTPDSIHDLGASV